MKECLVLLLLQGTIALQACSQTLNHPVIGGPCEGCEAIFESPIPFDKLKPVDTLPDYFEVGPKIEISGIVYHRDGMTPAKDVVLYIYHTDQTGHYATKGGETGWGKRHGYIRGWVKTDANGYYQFCTLRPAAYPNRKGPAHIHITVKEPDKNEYWIDEFLFDDDPLLKEMPARETKPRGGNGIVTLVPEKGGAHATRHIFLGLNVPGYPYAGLPKLSSGLERGANCPAFDPIHLSGADSGSKVCPMCKYGYGQGIMLWFNHANVDQMQEFVTRLENEMTRLGERKLRVFLIYMNPIYKQNPDPGSKEIIGRKLRLWCAKNHFRKVALLWIPSPYDPASAGLYRINPQAKNTVFVYRDRKVAAKWVNIEYTDEMLQTILNKL